MAGKQNKPNLSAEEPFQALGIEGGEEQATDQPAARAGQVDQKTDQLQGDGVSVEVGQTLDRSGDRKPDKILLNALEDCKVLYSYCARQGAEGFGKGLEGFFDTISAVEEKKYTNNDVEKIYEYLNTLTISAHPATPASIRGTFFANVIGVEAHEVSNQRLRVSLNIVQWIALVSFALTVLLALYVSVTDSIVKNATTLSAEFLLLNANQTKGTRLEGVEPIGQGPGTSIRVPAVGAGASAPEAIALEQATPGDDTADVDVVAEPQEAGIASDDPPLSDAELFAAQTDEEARDEALLSREQLLGYALDQVGKEIAYFQRMLSFTTFGLVPEDTRSSATARGSIYVQGYINAVLTNSIMPVLASILGVVVFIMRDASRRMESVSLSPLQSSGYRPRLILGVIAGLAVGWFTSSGDTSVVGTLSPTAAAFAIGYSTEILFNVLDSLRQGLGSKE